MGGGQTDRRLGEKLTKLGRGPAELPKDLVSGGNVLTWKQAGPWCLVFFDVRKMLLSFVACLRSVHCRYYLSGPDL